MRQSDERLIEVIPQLITIPYSNIQENLNKNQAIAAVTNSIKNYQAHELAKKVEDVIEEDKAIIRMGKVKFGDK